MTTAGGDSARRCPPAPRLLRDGVHSPRSRRRCARCERPARMQPSGAHAGPVPTARVVFPVTTPTKSHPGKGGTTDDRAGGHIWMAPPADQGRVDASGQQVQSRFTQPPHSPNQLSGTLCHTQVITAVGLHPGTLAQSVSWGWASQRVAHTGSCSCSCSATSLCAVGEQCCSEQQARMGWRLRTPPSSHAAHAVHAHATRLPERGERHTWL